MLPDMYAKCVNCGLFMGEMLHNASSALVSKITMIERQEPAENMATLAEVFMQTEKR